MKTRSRTREIEDGTDKDLARMKPNVLSALTDEASTDSDNIWQRAISNDFFAKLTLKARSHCCEVCCNMEGHFNPPSTMVPMPPIGCVEDFKIVINGVDFTPYSSTQFRSMYWDLCKSNGAYLHENSKDISNLAIYRNIIQTVKMARIIKNFSAETLSYFSSVWLGQQLMEINHIAGIDVIMIQNWLHDRSGTQKTKAHDIGPEVLGQDCDQCCAKKGKADDTGIELKGQEYKKMKLPEELRVTRRQKRTREIEGGTDKVLAVMKPNIHSVVADEASSDSDNIWQQAISNDFFAKLSFNARRHCCERHGNIYGCFNPPTGNPSSTMVPMPPIGCVEDFKIVINGVDFTPYSSTHFRSMYWDLCKSYGAYLHENSKDISNHLVIYRGIIQTVKMARNIKNSSIETLSDFSSSWLESLTEINRFAGIDVTMIQNWLCDGSGTQKTKVHDTGPKVLGQYCDRCGAKKRIADDTGIEVQGQEYKK